MNTFNWVEGLDKSKKKIKAREATRHLPVFTDEELAAMTETCMDGTAYTPPEEKIFEDSVRFAVRSSRRRLYISRDDTGPWRADQVDEMLKYMCDRGRREQLEVNLKLPGRRARWCGKPTIRARQAHRPYISLSPFRPYAKTELIV